MSQIKGIFAGLLLLLSGTAWGQFAPPAGQAGSTAIPLDDSRFVDWAHSANYEPGWVHIGDTSMSRMSLDSVEKVLGPGDGTSVLSLGDGGSITLAFSRPIRNGDGFDFAVFENGFSDTFLELAFVEVSSDGTYFVRFPATSNTPTDQQVGTFGSLDATQLNNLAGKYRGGFGTPFDLEEVKGDNQLDVNHITHIRIVDVVGSIQTEFATYDQAGQAVNDPWPTPFANSSGFDLDAVGVIHQALSIPTNEIASPPPILIYPNPVSQHQFIIQAPADAHIQIFDLQGQLLHSPTPNQWINRSDWPKGLYLAQIKSKEYLCVHKIHLQ